MALRGPVVAVGRLSFRRHPFSYERDQGGLTIRKIDDPEAGFRRKLLGQ